MNGSNDESVSILVYAQILWRHKWVFVGLSLAGAIIGYSATFFVVPQYRASIVALPLTPNDGIGNGMFGGQLGGLATLAGLGGVAGTGQEEALEFLQSRVLANDFIAENNLLPALFAEDWDHSSGKWKSGVDTPTIGEAFRAFDRIRIVTRDSKSGMVTLSVTWRDRFQAAEWANQLVAMANHRLRNRAVREAESSIEYLNLELKRTATVEVQQAIFSLLEEQIKTITLANVRKDYSFRVVDPAVVPDPGRIVRPRRLVIALACLLLTATIVAFFLWIRDDVRARRFSVNRQGNGPSQAN